MVRDAHGRKMSKSLGNVIDPLEVIDGIDLENLHKKLYEGNLPEKEIEIAKKGQQRDFPEGIPECGADALRFGLLAYTLQGRNVNLDINRVVGYRHFCNKVWNATRFGLQYFGDFSFPGALRPDLPLAWEDRWILSRLSFCAQKTNESLEKYEFANATTATYSFFLYELCDVYLELLKPRFYGETTDEAVLKDREVAKHVLYVSLDWSMRLMHPLLPYLTEELYQRLPPSPTKCESITIAPFPTAVNAWRSEALEREMEVTSEIAKQFRSQKTSLGFSPGARPDAFIRHQEEEATQQIERLRTQIARMAGLGSIQVLAKEKADPQGTMRDVVNEKCLIFTKVEGLDLSGEKAKLQKKVISAQTPDAASLSIDFNRCSMPFAGVLGS